MKILFVVLDPIEYATSAMLRNIGLINGLLSQGHEVEILTGIANASYNVHNENLFNERVTIRRVSQFKLYADIVRKREQTISRVKRLAFRALRAAYHKICIFDQTYRSACNANLNQLSSSAYDIVISSSDPKTSHKAVQVLKDKGLKYRKWIQYWGDPLTLDITSNYIWPKAFIKYIERMLIKDADTIVYVSPFTYEEQCKLYPKLAKKMHFLPISYVREKVFLIDKHAHKDGIFHIGYFGAFQMRIRNIIPLYNVCKSLKGQVELRIVGSSDIELDEQENIIIEPRQETSVINRYESESDLLVCLMNSHGTQIPGKIYHSAATNKPILVILDGERIPEMKRYLEKFNRFILCSNNEEDIRTTILTIMENYNVWQPSPEFAPEVIARQILTL